MKELKKPNILNIDNIARSQLFQIQSVNLEFSNGEKRIYERMKPTNREAVMIVPIIDDNLILIREYAVGIENYDFGFPKGAIDLAKMPYKPQTANSKKKLVMVPTL